GRKPLRLRLRHRTTRPRAATAARIRRQTSSRPHLRLPLSLGPYSRHPFFRPALREPRELFFVPLLQPLPHSKASDGRANGRSIFSRRYDRDEISARLLQP